MAAFFYTTWLARERNHRFLVNEFGDLSFFFYKFKSRDQILSIKCIRINFYGRIIHYHRKWYFASTRKGNKELYGKYIGLPAPKRIW